MAFISGSLFARQFTGARSILGLPLSANHFLSGSGSRFQFKTALRLPPTTTHSNLAQKTPLIYKGAGVACICLGVSVFLKPRVHCDAPMKSTAPQTLISETLPPPPSSSVSVYELTFGTICGVCAGIFVKKGAKFVAFAMGGIFVLLQYLGSLSVLRVDWVRMGSRFESLFFVKNPDGTTKPPSVYSVWVWAVDFLTANFQQRASFVAGLVLGLRIG